MTVRQPNLMQAASLPGPELARSVKGFLLAQGILMSVLALALFFAPSLMSALWPWKVTPLLAQMYAGPLLSYGLGSLWFSTQRQWLGVRAIVPAMLAFSLTTVIVSFIHVGLFSFAEIADLLWFAWFLFATVMLTLFTVRAMQARPV
jgi:hypothetical protein